MLGIYAILVVLIGILTLLVLLIYTGRALKIEVKHTYRTETSEVPGVSTLSVEELEKELNKRQSLDGAVAALNVFMTGGTYDDDAS